MNKGEQPNCELCGEPMPEGEEMFKYHGYSGPCPKPPMCTLCGGHFDHGIVKDGACEACRHNSLKRTECEFSRDNFRVVRSMNKSEIAEKAAREISLKIRNHTGQYYPHEFFMEVVERAIAESQAPQPTVSYGPPHNRDGEAGSCTRCGSIHRGVVKNRSTPEGREFWDHVDKVAADCCLRCGRTRPEHDFNSPTACGLFEEPHPTQQPVKKFEEQSRDLGNSESAESGAKIVTQENPPFVLSDDCESNSITTPPGGYNRDEVRRLEREIEESGTNRFVGRKESEPRGTCSKHVGLHVNIEELCEEWHEEREFDAYCKALGFWPTDENFKIWKESPLRGFATSGPLCDNCSKTSREHYCYFGSSYDEKFSPSERRSGAANEEARRLRIVIDTETKPLHAQIEKLKKDLADSEATCEAWMEEAERLKAPAELGDGEPSPPSPEPVCPMCCKPVFTDGYEGDTRELKAALKLAKTRLQICLGRFAGCEDGKYSKTTVTYGDKVEKRHEVSLAEIPAWIEEMNELLG
jgi:hypothetical protein